MIMRYIDVLLIIIIIIIIIIIVEANLHTAHHQASFLAATSQHSGDWLFALPTASCGLKLDDEAVRVAVGLRVGLDLCVPHNCHCGPQLTLVVFTALYARELRVDQQNITLLTK